MSGVLDTLAGIGVVPVVVIDDAMDAGAMGSALAAGGLPTAEITLRTPAAVKAIRVLSEVAGFTVGAGTVLTPVQVDASVSAGARYIVSPGFSATVARACADAGVLYLPGCATATDVQAAMEAGHDVVKFFPAKLAGGAPMIRALAGPFTGVRFVPTGGIDIDSLPEYLGVPAVAAVGGTWIAPRDLLAAKDFPEIERRAAAAAAIAKEHR